MQTTIVHKARDLSPEERKTIENLLGRKVQEDEVVQVSSSAEKAIAAPQNGSASLPKWPGRNIGDLRREDLYDDVR